MRHFQANRYLPLLVEEDFLENTHLSIPLGHLLTAVGPCTDQTAWQDQRSRGCPGHPLFHGVMWESPGHLKCMPVHHQLPLGRFTKIFNLIYIYWGRNKQYELLPANKLNLNKYTEAWSSWFCLYLSLSHPDQSKNILWAGLPQPSERSSFSCLSLSGSLPLHVALQVRLAYLYEAEALYLLSQKASSPLFFRVLFTFT